MFCKKCSKEIPDLSMYCPHCGASQFITETSAPVLDTESSGESEIIVTGYDNLTAAITAVRDLFGLDFVSARKTLSTLPAVIRSGLPRQEAATYARELSACGIHAEVHGGIPESADDPAADQAFEKELEAYEKEKELIMEMPAEEHASESDEDFEKRMAAFLDS